MSATLSLDDSMCQRMRSPGNCICFRWQAVVYNSRAPAQKDSLHSIPLWCLMLALACRALLPKHQLSGDFSPVPSSPVAGILEAYEAPRVAQQGREETMDAQELLDSAAQLVQLQDDVARLEERRLQAQQALQQARGTGSSSLLHWERSVGVEHELPLPAAGMGIGFSTGAGQNRGQ